MWDPEGCRLRIYLREHQFIAWTTISPSVAIQLSASSLSRQSLSLSRSSHIRPAKVIQCDQLTTVPRIRGSLIDSRLTRCRHQSFIESSSRPPQLIYSQSQGVPEGTNYPGIKPRFYSLPRKQYYWLFIRNLPLVRTRTTFSWRTSTPFL